MKKLFQEFKKFITRGNVLDLAVGVIVGGAFTAIVNGLSNNIIRPLINWLIALVGGKDGLASAVTYLSKSYTTDANGAQIIDLANSIYIDWGAFIAAIIDFFIIAFTIFMIVKVVNLSHEKLQELGDLIEHESKKEVIEEKKAVKAQAKSEGRKFKEVWAEHEAEKKRVLEEKQKAEAEAKAKKEAEDKLNNPTEQELLKQIRDLLVEANKTNEKTTKSNKKEAK
ncbi:MAG: large conductance mechanosensitive channel protein MscL [Clostridia bacterium]|nr:large conductance mechanosensitive channel protein MscL [Clostridia bacterium]